MITDNFFSFLLKLENYIIFEDTKNEIVLVNNIDICIYVWKIFHLSPIEKIHF